MGTIVLVELVSLDGVGQAPGNEREDPQDLDHGGWTQPFCGDHRRYLPRSTAEGLVMITYSRRERPAAHGGAVAEAS